MNSRPAEPTRRHVLAVGVGALGSLALGGCQHRPGAAPPARREGYIDAHSHVWTPDTTRFPLGPWIAPDKMDPASFTAEQLLAVAGPCGVDRVVLIQHAPYYGDDNAYLFDCVSRFAGTFSVVAIVDERRSDLGDHLRLLARQGARGLRIGPARYADRTPVKDPDRWLDAPAMRNLWTAATDQGLILCPLVDARYLPTLEPMLARFPNTTVVLDHFGHARADRPEDLAALLRLARYRHVHVKVSGFYKFGDQKPPYDDLAPIITHVANAFGPDRLLWGSDCPYQIMAGHNYPDAIRLIESGLDTLSPAARNAILRGTAERLFFS